MSDKAMDARIRQKLDKEVDNSLRGHAMERAVKKKVPKTLTPYEWQRWYAEHGIPEEHRKAESWLVKQWRKVKRRLAGQQGQ